MQYANESKEVQQLHFPGMSGGKPLDLEQTSERLTHDAGLTLFGLVDEQHGISASVIEMFAEWRMEGKVEHSIAEMVRQRIYGIIGGYEDANDAARLRRDPTLLTLLGLSLDDEASSQSTLSRLENAVTSVELMRASLNLADRILDIQARRRHPSRVRRVTIDLDPTDTPTYGQQCFTFFNAHYDNWCFLPMPVFVSFHEGKRPPSQQYLLGTLLRPGNAKAPLGARWMLRHTIAAVRERFPQAEVVVRLDGGFSSPEMFEFLDDQEVSYLVNMGKNSVLKGHAEPLMVRARAEAKRTGETATHFGECQYAAKSWKHVERRVIIKAEVTLSPGEPHKEPRDNPRFVVTNRTDTPEEIYKDYRGRGDPENRIKELHALGLSRLSCHEFEANQLRVLFSSVAMALVQLMRDAAASNDEDECADAAKWQAPTWRHRLVKCAAIVKHTTRRVLFSISRDAPFANLLFSLGQRLLAYSSP